MEAGEASALLALRLFCTPSTQGAMRVRSCLILAALGGGHHCPSSPDRSLRPRDEPRSSLPPCPCYGLCSSLAPRLI